MNWINLLILLLLVAGHTQLFVSLVNRIHGLRIPCDQLRYFRRLHDLAIPAFPVVLFWFVGWGEPRLLFGGSFADLSPGWSVYLALCGIGAVELIVSSARWLLRKIPEPQLSNHSRFVDVAEELGYRPLGGGRYRFLSHVPYNEIFRVEVAEKTFHRPELPEKWDGLSILHLSDFHFTGAVDLPFYQRVIEKAQEMQPDLIAFTGDLLDDPDLLHWVPKTLGRLKAPLGCYFVLGNHDWYLDPEAIRRCLCELGWHDVAGRSRLVEFRNKPMLIAGNELPWMGTRPNWDPPVVAGRPSGPQVSWSDNHDPMAGDCSQNAFRLLLSHSPDEFPWAKQNNVDLMLAGHNHGGQVVLPVIGPVYSPSRYGVRYASGTFVEGKTLMHVSRGLSGRHPLRWRCPPEITQLVLRRSP